MANPVAIDDGNAYRVGLCQAVQFIVRSEMSAESKTNVLGVVEGLRAKPRCGANGIGSGRTTNRCRRHRPNIIKRRRTRAIAGANELRPPGGAGIVRLPEPEVLIEETAANLKRVVVAGVAMANLEQMLPARSIGVVVRRIRGLVQTAPTACCTCIVARFCSGQTIAPINDSIGADVASRVNLFPRCRRTGTNGTREIRNARRAAADLQMSSNIIGHAAAELSRSLEVHRAAVEVGTARHEDVRAGHDVWI